MCHFFILMVLVFSSGTAMAQKQLPNEADLKTSYCLGVVRSTAAKHLPGSVDSLPESVREGAELMRKQTLSDLLARQQRLYNYLLPRLPYLDIMSLMAAKMQGEIDSEMGSKELSSCIKQCATNSDCNSLCLRTPLMTKFQMCISEPTYLPY